MSLLENPFVMDVKIRIKQMRELQQFRCLDTTERLELERLEALFKRLTTYREIPDSELPVVRRHSRDPLIEE